MSALLEPAQAYQGTPSSKGFRGFMNKWVRTPIARRLSPPSRRAELPPTTRTTTEAVTSKPVAFPTPVPEALPPAPTPSSAFSSTIMLPDGAELAYEILGREHLGRATPIVLICGMTSVRVDFERLTKVLVESHPVLIYDHRGMGDSRVSSAGDETITIELLARDLLALIKHVGWKQIALVGYSMGGVVAQQLLVLPHLGTNPQPLPFHISHVVLAGTRSVVTANAGLNVGGPLPPSGERTLEERIAIAKKIVSTLVDPVWLAANPDRFAYMFKRATNPALKRPSAMIAKQGAALRAFDFADHLDKVSTPILIIHGKLDQVIPFTCSEDAMQRLSTAKMVQVGSNPGEVPSLDFGHFWFEYFEARVWRDVIVKFVQTR